jgi:1-phosphatidylinositol phosphodiesterase
LFRYTGTYVVGFDLHSQFLRVSSDVPPAAIFQCQDKSLFDMLNLGIRVFDLRFAYVALKNFEALLRQFNLFKSYNPGNDTLGFHHSKRIAPASTPALAFSW